MSFKLPCFTFPFSFALGLGLGPGFGLALIRMMMMIKLNKRRKYKFIYYSIYLGILGKMSIVKVGRCELGKNFRQIIHSIERSIEQN